jgi:hypothetical protein
MMKPLTGAGSIAATVFLLFLLLGVSVGRWLGLVGT